MVYCYRGKMCAPVAMEFAIAQVRAVRLGTGKWGIILAIATASSKIPDFLKKSGIYVCTSLTKLKRI